MFPNIAVPENGWFIVENPIKMDDLGVPLFSETSIYTVSNPIKYAHIVIIRKSYIYKIY